MTSLIQKFVEPLRNALGSLLTIFSHLEERGPQPWPKECKSNKLNGLELPGGIDKPVEVRQPGIETVADPP